MWDNSLDSRLNKLIPEDRILRDEPMFLHTTFRAGGKATRFITVNAADELNSLLKMLDDAGASYSDNRTDSANKPT